MTGTSGVLPVGVADSEIRPGYLGADLHGVALGATRWTLAPSSTPTRLHRHPDHEQIGLVVRGSITMEIDGTSHTFEPGDVYWAGVGVPHGRMVIHGDRPAVIVDVFSPPRLDAEGSIEYLD